MKLTKEQLKSARDTQHLLVTVLLEISEREFALVLLKRRETVGIFLKAVERVEGWGT